MTSVAKRSSSTSTSLSTNPPKRAFASDTAAAPVSSLAGLAVIGRTGPLPATIAPTSSRRAPSDSISAPSYSPIAASTITPKPKPAVTPRKPAVSTVVSTPVVKKKAATPTSSRIAKTEESKPKKKVAKKDDQVTSNSNPAVPSEKKSAPITATPLANVTPSAAKPPVSASECSAQPISSRITSQEPFPEYSAKFARENAHVIQIANNLTTPYELTDDGFCRPGCRSEASKKQEDSSAAPAPAVKKFELDKHGRLTIPLTDLMEAVEWVHAKGKTSLILDPSKRVETFYSYNSTQLIEGKKLFLAKMHGAATLEAQLEALRKQYNAPTFFPTQKLFDAQPFLPVRTPKPPNASEDWVEPEPVFTTPSFCNDLTRQADKEKGGLWFNLKEPMIHKDYRMLVTSEFELEDYQEFLRESIPLQHCIVVQIIQPEGSEYQSPMKQLKHLLL